MTSRCCGEKGVIVAVYAERPQSKDRREGHYNHHIHKNVDGRGKGYNRKAELLEYARYLRASAKPAPASASLPLQPNSHIRRQLSNVEIDRKRKHSSPPTCLDKWEFLIPSFLRSMTAFRTTKHKGKKNHNNTTTVVSTATKMKSLVKTVQKKGSFLSKLLKSLAGRR